MGAKKLSAKVGRHVAPFRHDDEPGDPERSAGDEGNVKQPHTRNGEVDHTEDREREVDDRAWPSKAWKKDRSEKEQAWC